jgi:hypothetical protein
LQKHRNSAGRNDYNGQEQTRPSPPTEARFATFGISDLFGAQDVHEAQKPFFPVHAHRCLCAPIWQFPGVWRQDFPRPGARANRRFYVHAVEIRCCQKG